MPTLKDYREAHYLNTAKVSDNVRTLAVGAIGLIWIFGSKQADGAYQVPNALLCPTILVFIALALDFAQYLYGSAAWYFVFRSKEKQNTKEDFEFEVSNRINYPTYFLFCIKVVTLIAAYYYLLKFMYAQIKLI